MDINHLCKMANQIGQFHRSLPNRDEALLGAATHLRRFWDPRMRRELLKHIDESNGAELEPFVLEAITKNRAMLEPKVVDSR